MPWCAVKWRSAPDGRVSPRSNGAAERVCDWIDRHFPRRRRFSLRNAKRLTLVLALARAELANQADLVRYARIVKDRLAALPGAFHLAGNRVGTEHQNHRTPCRRPQVFARQRNSVARKSFVRLTTGAAGGSRRCGQSAS